MKRSARAGNFRSAFTLLELLVAMVILMFLVVLLANMFSQATSVYRGIVRHHDAGHLSSTLFDLIARDFRALTWGGPVGLNAQGRLAFPAYGRGGGGTGRDWGMVRYALTNSPDGYPALLREGGTHLWSEAPGTADANPRQELFAGVVGWGFQPVTNSVSAEPLGYVVTLACVPVSRLRRYDTDERDALKLPPVFTPVAFTNITALSTAWREHALTNAAQGAVADAYFISHRYLPMPRRTSPQIKDSSVLRLTPLL